jgi:ABC-2 type transport system permease protein
MLRLWSIYARMDVMWLMRDFNRFLLYAATDVLINFASVTGIWLIAAKFDGIGGMTIHQLLFMLGYSIAVGGVTFSLFGFNVFHISRKIGRGQMDHVLIMPQPIWVTLLTEGFTPASGGGVLLSGIGVMAFALTKTGDAVSVAFLIGLVACIVLSVAISVSFSFLWGSLAFYSPTGAEEVCTSVSELFASLRSFPLNGVGGLGKFVMLSFLPAGLYAWFPSMALMGLSNRTNILWLAAIGLAYFAAVLIIFKRGLRYYGTNGSYRYLDRGHRR